MAKSRSQILIMLYEAAVKNIKTARTDEKEKTQATAKATSIVTELKNSLDFEKGGDVAADLEVLYNYVLGRLKQGTDKTLWECETILSTLLDGWRDAIVKKDAAV